MKSVTLRLRASDKQVFEDIRTGLKEIETRAATVKYQGIREGDTLTFSCAGERFSKKVMRVYRWPSIDAMASEVAFRKVMPRAASVEAMKAAYASYPGYEGKLREYGLIGFALEQDATIGP